jgi:uncharacterized paraquat-inducible protein A
MMFALVVVVPFLFVLAVVLVFACSATWVQFIDIARVKSFRAAAAVEKQLLDVGDALPVVSAWTGFAISTENKVNVCSVTGAAVVFWIFVGILARGAIRSGIQFRIPQTLFAVAVGIHRLVVTHTFVLVPVKHKVLVADTFSNRTFMRQLGSDRDAVMMFLFVVVVPLLFVLVVIRVLTAAATRVEIVVVTRVKRFNVASAVEE